MIKTRMLNKLNQSLDDLKWIAYFNKVLQSNSNMLIGKPSANLLYKLYQQDFVTMNWTSFGATQPPRAKALHKLGLIYTSHVLSHYTWRLTPLGKQYANYLFKGIIPRQSPQEDEVSHDDSDATPIRTTSVSQNLSMNQKICLGTASVGTIGSLITASIGILSSSMLMSVISGLLTILFVIIMIVSSHRPETTRTVYGSTSHHQRRRSYQQVHAIDLGEALNNARQHPNDDNQFTVHMPGGDLNAEFSSGIHTTIRINGQNVFTDDPLESDDSASENSFNNTWDELRRNRRPITKKDFIRFLILFDAYKHYSKDPMNYLKTAINKILFPDQSKAQYNDDAHILLHSIGRQANDFMNDFEHDMNHMGDTLNHMFGNGTNMFHSDSDNFFSDSDNFFNGF